ncbi:MAG TPA: hypothetical protein VFV63_06945 [Ilumatobacteraceae bacterium]|nr:hypothetical protein [Ilumatobacteraceae bacterium]
MKKQLSVANLVMLAGSVVAFIFSFLAFYKFGDEGRSAWSGDAFAFATAVPAILALALAVVIVLELAGVDLPAEVLTFNWSQIKATWGIAAFGIMLSWLTVDSGGADKGIGFWLMMLGSIAMAVGAIMALLGKGTETVKLGGASSSDTAPPPPPPPAV